MGERLVINSRGEERIIYPKETTQFPEKKIPVVDEESILRHLTEARKLYQEMAVGQREATVNLEPQNKNIPVFIWLLNDFHAGSVHTDYERFLHDYEIIRQTPNFYAVTNGDLPDNFLVDTAQAAGVYEDTITPEQQGLLVQNLLKKLDKSGKLLATSFGNHEDFVQKGGLSFEGTWLRDLSCPVFNCGGLLTIKLGGQEYKLAMTHRFWGHSRLNPTNAAKRLMEHVYPDADIIYLGHSHINERLSFFRGDKWRLAVVGGTYKIDDEFGQKRGMGGGGQQGGMVLKLSSDRKMMEVIDSVDTAKETFCVLAEIKEIRNGQGKTF